MWFLTQHKRWGLLKDHPDYLAVAKQVNQTELYKQAAAQLKVSLPKSDLRSSKLIDGVVWDGKDPAKYADGFKVKPRRPPDPARSPPWSVPSSIPRASRAAMAEPAGTRAPATDRRRGGSPVAKMARRRGPRATPDSTGRPPGRQRHAAPGAGWRC
jgi:hypothetical protein